MKARVLISGLSKACRAVLSKESKLNADYIQRQPNNIPTGSRVAKLSSEDSFTNIRNNCVLSLTSISEQFDAVGITNINIHHEPLGCQMTAPQQWWDVVWNAGFRSLLNQLSEDEQKVFEKVHREEIAELLGEEGIWFNTEVLIAVGEK